MRVEEGGNAVDEFRELGHFFDKVRSDKIADPFRRLLAKLRLQFDLEDGVWEAKRNEGKRFAARASQQLRTHAT